MKEAQDPLGAFCPGPRVSLPGSGTGPLEGLTFAAKDNFDVAGFTTGAGNPDWLASHRPAKDHAAAVDALLEAGAELVGKTIMDELAYGSLGQNRHYGTPRNSAAPGRVPGGSSSGSASAVAGGVVDFALGTDSACSVRLPGSLCGLYGMRPTHGRVDLSGVVPLSPSLDTVGWLARSAEVMQRVGLALLTGAANDTQPTRLLYPEDAFALAEPGIADALAPGIERLCDLVGPVVPMTLGEPGTPRDVGRFLPYSGLLQVQEVWSCHGDWIDTVQPNSVVLSRENLTPEVHVTPEKIRSARRGWDEMRAFLRPKIPADALLLLPTTVGPAPLCGLPGEEYQSFTYPSLCLLAAAVLAGFPQLTIPGALVEGHPIGLSIVGPPGADEVLLASALGA